MYNIYNACVRLIIMLSPVVETSYIASLYSLTCRDECIASSPSEKCPYLTRMASCNLSPNVEAIHRIVVLLIQWAAGACPQQNNEARKRIIFVLLAQLVFPTKYPLPQNQIQNPQTPQTAQYLVYLSSSVDPCLYLVRFVLPNEPIQVSPIALVA